MKLLLVEDDAGTREALSALLQTCGHTVAAACRSGEEALSVLLRLEEVDLAIVDLMLPGISGIETIGRLCAARPALPVLVHTAFENADLTVKAIRAGASGYILKGGTREELEEAIRQTAEGLSPLSPEAARHVLASLRGRDSAPPADRLLSEREREVLGLLMRGHPYQGIAGALGLRLGTVQTHVKRIYAKLQVASKAEAVWVAFREGLLREEAGT